MVNPIIYVTRSRDFREELIVLKNSLLYETKEEESGGGNSDEEGEMRQVDGKSIATITASTPYTGIYSGVPTATSAAATSTGNSTGSTFYSSSPSSSSNSSEVPSQLVVSTCAVGTAAIDGGNFTHFPGSSAATKKGENTSRSTKIKTAPISMKMTTTMKTSTKTGDELCLAAAPGGISTNRNPRSTGGVDNNGATNFDNKNDDNGKIVVQGQSKGHRQRFSSFRKIWRSGSEAAVTNKRKDESKTKQDFADVVSSQMRSMTIELR